MRENIQSFRSYNQYKKATLKLDEPTLTQSKMRMEPEDGSEQNQLRYELYHNTLKVNRTTLTVNQLVVGSIPTAGAIFLNISSKMQGVLNLLFLYNKSYKEL